MRVWMLLRSVGILAHWTISGYWKNSLDADAQEKSVFATDSGLWKWKVLPFEMTSVPANFKHMMDQVLYGFNWKTLLLYLGDVIVIFLDFGSHLQRLDKPFKRLQDAGLKLKPTKCKLLKDKVYYLGCVMSAKDVASDSAKVQDFQR